jgi:uncharacterized protein (TIGR02246 family)
MRKCVTAIVVVTACITFGATPSFAQEEEVRSAMLETLAAWSEGDFERFAEFYHPQSRGFLFDGGFLVEGFDAELLRAAYEAGFRATMQVRDVDIRIFGDVAVTTAYADGSLTLPGGAVQNGTWRYTEVRVREGGTWKIVQYHFSPLDTP